MKHVCKNGKTLRALPKRAVLVTRQSTRVLGAPAFSVKADISYSGKSYVVAISRKVYPTSKWEWTHSKVFDNWAGALRNYHAINEMGKKWEERQTAHW